MPNGPERQAIIDQMLEILRHDAPWVWGFIRRTTRCAHQWVHNRKPNKMANNGLKYQRIDPLLREQLRRRVEPPDRVAADRCDGRAGAGHPARRGGVPAARALRRARCATAGASEPCSPICVRRIVYAVPILIGVNLITFALFFFVNSPDDMARMQLGQKRVTPEAIQKMEGRARLRQADAVQREGAGRAQAHRHHLLREVGEHVLVRFRLRRRRPRHRARDHARACGRASRSPCPASCSGLLVFITLRADAGVLSCDLRRFLRRGAMRRGDVDLGPVLHHRRPVADQQAVASGADLRLRLRLRRLEVRAVAGLVGVVGGIGGATRLYRTIFLEEINKDYVRTARAKGLSEMRVLFRHVLQNGMIPILTGVVVAIPTLVHRQPGDGIVLRHSGPGQLHDRRDPVAGFPGGAGDGVPRRRALHRRADPHRHLLHARRSARAVCSLMPFKPDHLCGPMRWSSCWSRSSSSAAWYIRRHEHLRAPWRKVAHSRYGMCSLVVLTVFVAVGPARFAALSAAPRYAGAEGKANYAVEVRSLFDVLVDPLGKRPERTYSAPLAAHAYAKETIAAYPTAREAREFPRLKLRRRASQGSGTTNGASDIAAPSARRAWAWRPCCGSC